MVGRTATIRSEAEAALPPLGRDIYLITSFAADKNDLGLRPRKSCVCRGHFSSAGHWEALGASPRIDSRPSLHGAQPGLDVAGSRERRGHPEQRVELLAELGQARLFRVGMGEEPGQE